MRLSDEDLPRDVRDVVLDHVMADDEEVIGTALHNMDDRSVFFGYRYPILRTWSALRRDGSIAFVRANAAPIEQPVGLASRERAPSDIRAALSSLIEPYEHRDDGRVIVDQLRAFGILIKDQFFVPYEFQTMGFGDLVWDHSAPAVVETFYNAAGLLSGVQEMIEDLSLDRNKVRFQIVYTLSTKYAAECFGDHRVKDLWHDIPVVVDIMLGDVPATTLNPFEQANLAAKTAYDENTADSVREMTKRGYIPDTFCVCNCASAGAAFARASWTDAKDAWYRDIVLPGREAMFSAWLDDVRPYHEMLVRVLNHMWKSPVSERRTRRELFTLDRLGAMNLDLHLDSEDLKGYLSGVGQMMEAVEEGGITVAGVSPNPTKEPPR